MKNTFPASYFKGLHFAIRISKIMMLWWNNTLKIDVRQVVTAYESIFIIGVR